MFLESPPDESYGTVIAKMREATDDGVCRTNRKLIRYPKGRKPAVERGKMTTNKNTFAQRALGSLMLSALLIGSVVPTADAQTRTRRARRPTVSSRTVRRVVTPRIYSVRANEIIRVRMDNELSSENARVGQRFTTTVVDPVYGGGVEVIPAGSKITGRVTEVKRAGRRSQAGTMSVEFTSLSLPNNAIYTINGALTETERGSVNVDNESQVGGRSSTKRNVIFIGGGAGTGAAIGAIAGGGKGAGIGAGVGAGLGVAGALLSRGDEAKVRAGTEFGVILNRSIALPAANVR